MAIRYNTCGWHNLYALKGQNLPGATGVQQLTGVVSDKQALHGLIYPQGLTHVEVRNDKKVSATPSSTAASVSVSTTEASGDNDQLTGDEKYKFRSLGAALCILSSFTLGLAVSYTVFNMNSNVNGCPNPPPTNPSSSSMDHLKYWGVRAAAYPAPLFIFIIGILCVIVRDRKSEAQAMYGMSVFTLILFIPLLALSGVGGIMEALQCATNPATIGVVYLILPIILLIMAVIFFALLIHLLVLVSNALQTSISKTITETQVTTTQPAAPSTPQPQPTLPAPPTTTIQIPVVQPVLPPVQPVLPPIQPVQPPAVQPVQPYLPQIPTQPIYGNGMYSGPSMPGIYAPPRYPIAYRPYPRFGPSPYGRAPIGSPYGYSPFRGMGRPMVPYRPKPYYF